MDLRTKYPGLDRDIRWAVDDLYTSALEDIVRDWENTDPRPTVAEMYQMISLHDDGLADAWETYMEDYEDEDAEPDPRDAPGLAGAVEWLVREYEGDREKLFSEIDMERSRHRRADTSDIMVQAIIYRYAGASLALAWDEWAKNR